MDFLKILPDDEYVRTAKIAQLWEIDHVELLELLKKRNVIEVEVINAAVNSGRVDKKTDATKWEGHPTLYEILRIPLRQAQIKVLIKKKQMPASVITYNGLVCTPIHDENFDLTLDDLYIQKKTAVKVAEEFGFGQQTPPLSLELAIAMDCYNTLYPKGPPSNPNRNDEAKEIIKWLKNNYTHMGDGENVNLREMLVFMVNPAPNKRIINFPQRKK